VTALALALFVALQGAPVVVDGDTFDAGGARYRIADLDAPEPRGRCPAERALGRLATARLAALLASGPVVVEVVEVQPATRRYRERLVARVWVDTPEGGRVDVAAALVDEGLARWEAAPGGWCETIRD
jgi:micrococcal nuclease